MNNVASWEPTKFVMTPEGLRASCNPKYLSRGSRFIANIQAKHYERAIRAHANGRLLDLGCGHVPLYEVYRNLVSENVCLDWENSLHANPFLDETADLNNTLPFSASSFDTILMTDVLEHIVEPAKVMNHLSSILRTGGKLILSVPFFYWLHEEPHDYYRYTEYALRRFCQIAELKVVDIWSYGGLPEILIDLTSKGIDEMPRWLAQPLQPLRATLSILGSSFPAQKISTRTKTSFPLGYMLVAEKPLRG